MSVSGESKRDDDVMQRWQRVGGFVLRFRYTPPVSVGMSKSKRVTLFKVCCEILKIIQPLTQSKTVVHIFVATLS